MKYGNIEREALGALELGKRVGKGGKIVGGDI